MSRYVERGEIRPLVALSFPLNRIVEAQKALLERRHVGKIVLVPEHPNDVVEEGPEKERAGEEKGTRRGGRLFLLRSRD